MNKDTVEQKEQIRTYIKNQLNLAIEKGDNHLKTILLRVLDELKRRR